jgi:hypothetical protein
MSRLFYARERESTHACDIITFLCLAHYWLHAIVTDLRFVLQARDYIRVKGQHIITPVSDIVKVESWEVVPFPSTQVESGAVLICSHSSCFFFLVLTARLSRCIAPLPTKMGAKEASVLL